MYFEISTDKIGTKLCRYAPSLAFEYVRPSIPDNSLESIVRSGNKFFDSDLSVADQDINVDPSQSVGKVPAYISNTDRSSSDPPVVFHATFSSDYGPTALTIRDRM